MARCYKNKNDYTVIFFFKNRRPIKYTYVHNVLDVTKYVKSKYGPYKYINVYNRRCKTFLKRYYYNDFVKPKPK